jgi:SAM-dependent methyltransferase
MAPHVWKMGAEPGLDLYRKHMGSRHLDVGPGTGYFIVETNPPIETDLTLIDPNENVLDHCAKTLAAWEPTMVIANVLKPLPIPGPFDSAALTHVIHCLPGPMPAKGLAIENIAATLVDDGVPFGGTVLGLSGEHTCGRPANSFALPTSRAVSTIELTMWMVSEPSSRIPSRKWR